MNKILLNAFVLFCATIFTIQLNAQATGFGVSSKKCNSLQLSWSSSKTCIIIAKEGSSPDFVPSNNNTYAAISYFNLKGNTATTYGTNCYIVGNFSGHSLNIDSLKPCTDYYFTIYEHDNNGSATIYDTASSRIKVSTYCQNLNFSVIAKDSCEGHNQFEFKNTSITNIPNQTFKWDFGDGTTDTGKIVSHKYYNKNGVITVLLNAPNNLGCPNYSSVKIRIYPKKVGSLDKSKLINPQCLKGNYFEVDITPLATPFPKSFTYNWTFGDGGTSTSKKMKYSYKSVGDYNVWVEIVTNVNQTPTGCNDTLRFIASVRKNPDAKVEYSDSVQCINGNSFSFNSKYFYKTKNKWNFGDGKFDTTSNTTHQYTAVGNYYVSHILSDSIACADTFIFKYITLNSVNSNFTGLDTAYCAKKSTIKLFTSSPLGQFYGYPVKNSLLRTDSVGTYQLKYAIRLKNCSDSTIKNFKIKSTYFPNLGANVIINTGQNIVLDAGPADYYLWNTGDTTQKITVSSSQLQPGSNRFIVKAFNRNGCFAADTIIIGLGHFSNLNTISPQHFKVYPNPVNSILYFNSGTSQKFEWSLYNLEGKTMAKGDQNMAEIDLSHLEKGLYFIQFESGLLRESYKISKQ